MSGVGFDLVGHDKRYELFTTEEARADPTWTMVQNSDTLWALRVLAKELRGVRWEIADTTKGLVIDSGVT